LIQGHEHERRSIRAHGCQCHASIDWICPGEKSLCDSGQIQANSGKQRQTLVSITAESCKTNGRPTYAGRAFRGKEIFFNADDHFEFDKPTNNMLAAISEYASWGYFDPGKNNYDDGYQSPPVRWDINTLRKRAFFSKLAEVTGSEIESR